MNEGCGLYIVNDGEVEESIQVPLEGVKASAEVVGRGARVTITQRFRNRGSAHIEAVYKFPLTEGAAVCGFGGVISGREIRGEVEEREKAFELYDEALTKGDLATLLDQERPNIFTLSVGRIDPGAEAVIRVDYVTLLDTNGKVTRFLLPTTISPRYLPSETPDGDGIPEDEVIHPPYAEEVPYGLSLTVQIRKGSFLRSVESPSHPIKVERLKGDILQVTLAQEEARMDRDFILNLEEEGHPAGRAYRQTTDDGEFLQVDFCPPAEEKSGGIETKRQREVIFLLDCSGSMDGDSIAEVRKAVEICLKAMKEGALFNICRFGSRHESLFPAPVLYNGESVGKALEYVRKMDADLGGTEILKPLRDILSGNGGQGNRGRDIVLLTDGEVGNEAEIFKLLKKKWDVARVFPIGIGAGCNEHFIKGLARAGMGASEFIYPGERIEPKTIQLFGLLGQAPVTELTVSCKGEQAPSDPVVFLGRQATIFVKGKKGEFKKGKLTLKGNVKGSKRTWEVEVAEAGEEGLPIPTLWARERIRNLEEGRGVKGSRQAGRKKAAVEKEVIALSKQYGILSQSTSYVAVRELEEKDRYTGEVVLKKIPSLVTVGWHGIGSLTGRHHAAQEMLSISMDADVSFSLADLPVQSLHSFNEITRLPKLRVRAPAPPPKLPMRDDILMMILSCQQPRGGFQLNDEVAGLLGFSLNEIERAAGNLTVRVPLVDIRRFEDPRLLLTTAVTMTILERVFPEGRQTWEPVAEKSREWLFEFILRFRAKIGDRDIRDWAEKFVQQHVHFPG